MKPTVLVLGVPVRGQGMPTDLTVIAPRDATRASSRLAVAGLLSTALLLSGCASMQTRACGSGEQRMIEQSLYFGTQTPDGAVTPEQWSQFLGTVVTPRFPQGLSVWPGTGQWRAADGSITHEASYVLKLLHPDDAASEAAVREIAADYRQRFRQEAVMRVRAPACVSF